MSRKPWDLKIIQIYHDKFHVEAGISLNTPVYKLRYTDTKKEWRRSLTCIINIAGTQLVIKIPMWRVKGEPT